jgi:uncharacterized heparinase superfamily protein
MTGLLTLAHKALKKPPRVVLARARSEALAAWERVSLPVVGPGVDIGDVLRALGDTSIDACWSRLSARPFPAFTQRVSADELDEFCPGESARVFEAARRALRHEVSLLGMADTHLGDRIDWHMDYKTRTRWAPAHHTRIVYATPDDESDVKVAWEISRLHWALPLCRAYQLTADDRFAAAMRAVIEDWIAANPYASTVNWTCTMEVALRIVSWAYSFHVCWDSPSWRDRAFRARFLRTLYLHGRFARRHFEQSDVNGNHCTADAAGLVIAALFFGRGREPDRWLEFGWQVLLRELPIQVFSDGVDYEASTAYHRLVLELFFLPALHRQRSGLDVPDWYVDRVSRMASFSASYLRPDGTAPYWGDADDARALPLGTQPVTDHRYLAGWVGAAWNRPELLALAGRPTAETCWSLGTDVAMRISGGPKQRPSSRAFVDAGVFIMRSGDHHVFIDCGPVGLAGRGGHGHNDCLSFEATLDGTHVVADCGSFVYTASYAERNRFRSTSSHNTPEIDGEEQNRFISPVHLWNLVPDAEARIERWESSPSRDVFVGSHTGYERLADPVRPVRRIALDKRRGLLAIRDTFTGRGSHAVTIPLHFAPDIAIALDVETRGWRLVSPKGAFLFVWFGEGWNVALEPARVSPQYGVAQDSWRLVWRGQWSGRETLTCLIWPERGELGSVDSAIECGRELLADGARDGITG